jgi:hypothetical protein
MRVPRPSLEDLVEIYEINQVLNLYSTAVNRGRFDLFDDCFASSVHIENQAGVFTTRDEFRSLCIARDTFLDANFHMIGNVSITVMEHRATAFSYVLSQHVRNTFAPNHHYLIGGWNDDVLEYQGGRWLIVRRTQTQVWSDGNPDILHE